MNTILFARLGEVARVSVLRRKLHARGAHLPVSTAVGTLVTEQILSGITLVVVLIAVVAYVPVPRQALQPAGGAHRRGALDRPGRGDHRDLGPRPPP